MTHSSETPVRPVEIDVETLREKYRRERDKRIRATGTDQFAFTEGKYAHFEEDPYAGAPRASASRCNARSDVLDHRAPASAGSRWRPRW